MNNLTVTTKTNHLRSKNQYSQKPLFNPLTNLRLSEPQSLNPGIHKVKRPFSEELYSSESRAGARLIASNINRGEKLA
jgi:hypothetical protein